MSRQFQPADQRCDLGETEPTIFGLGSLRSEDSLLYLAAAGTAEAVEKIGQIASTGVDWVRLLKCAEANRVVVSLAHCLVGCDAVPAKVKWMLVAYELRLQQSINAQKDEFERVLPTILRDNEVILLRGISYAYTIYKDIPIRPIGDVDLLVDMPVTLSFYGHISDHLVVPQEVRESCKLLYLEYHRDLNINAWWYSSLSRIRMSELWERSLPLTIAGHHVRLLSREDAFIYLSYHNVAKGFCRLYRFVDMLHILADGSLDWDAIVDRSKQYKLTSSVWANCVMLNTLRPGTVPAQVVRQIQPGSIVRRLVGRTFSPEAVIHFHHRRSPSSLLVRLLLVRLGIAHKVVFGDVFRWLGDGSQRLYEMCLAVPMARKVVKSALDTVKRRM
jgi:hypothetical protein